MEVTYQPLIFKSETNNIYFYDDLSGIVIPITEKESATLKKIEIGQSQQSLFSLFETSEESLLNKIKKYNMFFDCFENEDEINFNKLLQLNGIKNITLNVTDACNFRCKYCIYSDSYFYSHGYGNKNMEWNVAKKAIDFYFLFNEKSLKYNPNIGESIGFYGGEPLLNWDLIKKTVNYINDNYSEKFPQVNYSITTNGYLLNEEKIKFMYENNFFISLSMDGDKYNHDKNRLTIDGKGTFDRVIKSLYLLETLKDEFNNQSDYNIIITYDNLTDLLKMNEFFKKNKRIDGKIIMINRVSSINTTHYDKQLSKDVKDKRDSQFTKIVKEFINNLDKDSLNTKFSKLLIKDQVGPLKTCINYKNRHSLTCVPCLQKLNVGVEGNYFICEKMNGNMPIGNVDTGLDIDLINIYITKLKKLNEKCKHCNVRNLCGTCYCQVLDKDDKFELGNDYCEKVRKAVYSSLKLYYTICELHSEVFEKRGE